MLQNCDLDEGLDENMFDLVNAEYTTEYEIYVGRVDRLLSTSTTIRKVGGQLNYDAIISWTNNYNAFRAECDYEAADIRRAVNKTTCDINYCVNNGLMFWNFLKTSHFFKKSPWYYREYMVEKLMGTYVVDVEAIL